MLQKNISPSFNVLFLPVAVSHSGHHDSLVRGIVICYTKSFHLFKVLFLLIVFLTLDTRIYLSEGLWYVTQCLSGPHMGEGGMLPCREGSC
jgi:hypothetical protein